MNSKEEYEEKALLRALEKRDIKAFIKFYKDYGEDILIFAYSMLQDARLASQVVDRLFEKLWTDANFETIQPPIYKYLKCEVLKICSERS